jgi:hypothetical protein
MRALAAIDKRASYLLPILVVCLVAWYFGDTFKNPALFGDDYFNTARSFDVGARAHILGFLAPNNSYDNRPLGNSLYRGLYHAFGVHPLPYVAVLFGLHLINALLGYLLASRLLQNRIWGALCSVVWAINFNFGHNVYSFNVIYDNLAFLGWTACLLLYLQDRSKNNRLKYLAAVGCCLICTRCKEIGVMLPLSLLAYEIALMDGGVLTSRNKLTAAVRQIAWRQWPYYAVSILFVVFYLRGSAWGFNSKPEEPYYMRLNYESLIEGLKYYFSCVSFNRRLFDASPAIYVAVGVGLIWAILLRGRILCWAFFTFLIALLPVVFLVNHRSQSYLYLPFFYLVVALVGLGGLTIIRIARHRKSAGAALAIVFLSLIFVLYCRANSRHAGYMRQYYGVARADANLIISHLKMWHPSIPPRARFYFLGLPDNVPGPDLFLAYMPDLLYQRGQRVSFLVSNPAEILEREAMRSDRNFYCFEFPPAGGASRDVILDRTRELRNLKFGTE